jgi:hypothetical protein
MSRRRVQRVLNFDLAKKFVRRTNVQLLSEEQKRRRVNRCTEWLQNRQTLWSDECMFNCSPRLNRYNDGFYIDQDERKAGAPRQRLTRESQLYAPGILVWAGVSYTGKATLVIFPRNMRLDSQVGPFNFMPYIVSCSVVS